RRQQALAIVDPRWVEFQLHVALQRTATAGNERSVRRAETSRRIKFTELFYGRPRRDVDRARKESRVEWDPGEGIVRSSNTSEERTHVRADRSLADDRLDVVVCIARAKAAHDC